MKLAEPIYKFTPSQERILEFKGYNKKMVIEDGEMRDMYNLSSDEYPCLAQRKPRGLHDGSFEHPTEMIVKNDKLAIISKGKFCYDGMIYPSLKLSDQTQMVAINTKICFFPEKMYFDTVIEDIASLEASVDAAGVTASVTNNDVGAVISFPKNSGVNLDDFMPDDAVSLECILSYVVTDKEAGTSETITKTFKKGTAISAVVKALTQENNSSGATITLPDQTFIEMSTAGVEKGTLTDIKIGRKCPDLDFVMESNNRLWGVSNKDNTIYACKLGDPTNWQYFQNTGMDSYYATQGTDGEWTGCAAYSKHLLFFKEECIHKVYGSVPASYQIETAKCHALEKGSSKSVAIINEIVFYKSKLGVMAYSGGTPILISEKFGTDRYHGAVAGTDGIKYYLSVMQEDTPRLLVYDVERYLWHKEDNLRVREFCYYKGKLLYIDDSDNGIYEINSDNPLPDEAGIKWTAELGPFDEYMEDKKIYSKIKMRLKLDEYAELAILVSMDEGEWERLEHINAERSRSLVVPIVPRRCDKFAIRLEGKGRCKIESFVRQYRQGSSGRL